jgi:transcriptional regulator with XRE-family HTH domain
MPLMGAAVPLPAVAPIERPPAVDRTPPPVASSVVAARLRWFRTERGLRLEDVAKRAGYTKGFLSKIEHGKASPPMATLLRVAAALGVEADVLFAPDAGVAPDASVHTAAGQGVPVRDDTAGPGRSLLAVAANRHHKLMEPFVVTLQPGQAAAERRLTYPGEEFVYVLEGEVEYTVGDEIFVMKAGDGLYFNATRPHGAVARAGQARFIRVFCASPSRRQRASETLG